MVDSATKLPVKSEEKSLSKAESSWLPFESLRSEIDRLFDDFTPSVWRRPFNSLSFSKFSPSITSPAIDLVEKDTGYEITAELPGMDQKDIEIQFSSNVLTIKGEKQENKDEKKGEYYVSERRYGSFRRSFQVPQGVDADKIAASFKSGLLTIDLPKSAEAQKSERKISVNAA